MSEKSLSSTIDEAQNILDAAKRKSKQLLDEAKIEYEQAKEKGYKEGLEQGEIEVSKTAVRLIQDSTTVGKQLAEHAAKLAFAITEQVINKSVELEPEIALEIALNALKETVVGSSVSIITNEQDAKVLEKNSKLLNKASSGSKIEIVIDSDISRGGCIVRTDYGEVDSRINTLIEELEKETLKKGS